MKSIQYHTVLMILYIFLTATACKKEVSIPGINNSEELEGVWLSELYLKNKGGNWQFQREWFEKFYVLKRGGQGSIYIQNNPAHPTAVLRPPGFVRKRLAWSYEKAISELIIENLDTKIAGEVTERIQIDRIENDRILTKAMKRESNRESTMPVSIDSLKFILTRRAQ